MLQNTVLIWNTILHTSSKYKMRFLLNLEIYPGMNISTLKLTLIQITTQQNPYTINHISTQRTSKRNTHIKLVKKTGSAVHLISIASRALRKAIYLLKGAKKKPQHINSPKITGPVIFLQMGAERPVKRHTVLLL